MENIKSLIEEANEVYLNNFPKNVSFERAIFFSWYCSLGDCTFCYMSLNKEKQDPKKARRRFSSILAEAIICNVMGWKIEFISGGYESYSREEIKFLLKTISEIYGNKLWINIGTLSKSELENLKEYVEGYAGTVETVNWDLRKIVCPSKKLKPILKTFQHCSELNIPVAITIIVGIGETIDDFPNLKKFIEEYNISRITFYALNPHKGTPFKEPPTKEYVAQWIAKTRLAFPKIYIIAGAWLDKIDYYPLYVRAGANGITKLPIIRKFASNELKTLKKSIKQEERILNGFFDELPKIDIDKLVQELNCNTFSPELKTKIKIKLESYFSRMKSNLS